ncbi:hypothetical protein EXS70_03905 [Candidatus Peribacteria bacterium]|nr:hypothetical protein [Candidatus Peribacteria bacterium]
MKKFLLAIGLPLLVALPWDAAAARTMPAGSDGYSAQLERPSRRVIRASVRETYPQNTDRPTISEVQLDRTFEDSSLGVKIQYPSSWSRQDLMEKTPPLTLVVMFLSPEEHPVDLHQNINLVVEDLPTDMTLAQYSELGLEMERKFFDEFLLLESQDIILAGMYRAHRVVFTASLAGGEMTFEQIWLLRGKTAHVWTFADSADVFEEHLNTFERMMDTLTVR